MPKIRHLMCLLKHNAQPKTITHSGKNAIPNSTSSNLPHPLYRVLTGISLASKPPPKRILFGIISSYHEITVRNLNLLTAYDRINRIYKITVRTKSCRRWRWSCHESKRERIDYRWRVLPIQSLISIRQFRDSLETSQKPMNFATWWQTLLFKSLRACNSFLV